MVKHFATWKPQGETTVNMTGVQFPYLSVRRLKALRAWADYCFVKGIEADSRRFSASGDALLPKWLERLQEMEQLDKTSKLDKTTNPVPKLGDMDKWQVFSERFMDHLRKKRTAMAAIPLTFVVREREDPGLNQDEPQEFNSIDEDLIRTTVHTGPMFVRANKEVFAALKEGVLDGPGWTFIKKFERKLDGRGAFMSLKAQATGQSAVASRKAKAYASIAGSVYHGNSTKFTMDDYILAHQTAHNTLLELDEPVPETKKVTDFMNGIQAAFLDTGKMVVNGDSIKLTNFETCQQYFKTIAINHAVRSKTAPARKAASVKHSAPKKGKKGTNGGKKPPKESSGLKIHSGKYTPAEYGKLTPSERTQVRELRLKEAKKVAVIRTIGSVTVQADEDVVMAESTANLTTANTTTTAGTPPKMEKWDAARILKESKAREAAYKLRMETDSQGNPLTEEQIKAVWAEQKAKAKLKRERRCQSPVIETPEEQTERLFAIVRKERAEEKRMKDSNKKFAALSKRFSANNKWFPAPASDEDETEWDDTKAVEPAKSKGKPPVEEVAIVTQFGRSGHASA